MKKISIIFCLSGLFSGVLTAQDQTTLQEIEARFETKLNSYTAENSLYSEASFDAQFPKIFQTAFVNPDGVVYGGRAASYQIDQHSHVLSANYNVPSANRKWLFNIGLNVQGSNNGFLLSKSHAWYNNSNLAIGVDHVLNSWGSKTTTDDEKVSQLQNRRKAKVQEELTKLNNQSYLAQQKITDSASIEKYIDRVLMNVDNQIPAGKRYGAIWFNATANAGLTTFGMTGTANIEEALQEKYKSMFRPSVNIAFNYFQRNVKSTQYAKVYGGFTVGNIFDSPIYKDMNMSVVASQSGYQVVDANNRSITAYEYIKDKITFVDAGVYYANFFAFKQALGLSANAAVNFPISNHSAGRYSHTYAFLIGPVLKMNGPNDWTAATLSLTAGMEQKLYSDRMLKDPVVRLGLAVPFELFKKK